MVEGNVMIKIHKVPELLGGVCLVSERDVGYPGLRGRECHEPLP